ncbi:hypothetical protein SARC_07313 [Sphaeroforma arctica JP610]|uniref:Uncharacterized protein n=1 Tax=Sphaeroforma arctica JP610 TaxID=667725 RepID=A0A0L0FU20_9EUKA|nr:hypothetical protein SARC_07313 [Sphaeroforma arctica JP610]KNC80322.1 hypothetical protein SARC_07313 [Sphaeroforma arctica JP610]|eukprot:XP_014154224.1 hypothetical protein SARC_07313 [Sphaeroforma arctica JP610]
MPMASEEAAEECCACIPEEISDIPIASDDAMMTGMPTDNTVMVRRQGGPDIGISEIGECCPCDLADIPLPGETGIFEGGLADAVSDVATDLLDDLSDVLDAITDAVDQIKVAAEKLG